MANPKGYGLKAFELGCHGQVEPVTVSNRHEINLTTYSVSNAGEHFVTLINKEHGAGAREAEVTIAATGTAGSAEVIFLDSRDGDAAAKTGLSLGGGTISAQGPWEGKWMALTASQPGQFVVRVPAVSAAIVRFKSS
jgi:hypothetical protein